MKTFTEFWAPTSVEILSLIIDLIIIISKERSIKFNVQKYYKFNALYKINDQLLIIIMINSSTYQKG